MHDLLRKRYMLAAADTPNIDGAAAVAEFVFPNPVIITKVGHIVTTAVVSDDAVLLTATLSRRPTVGSATNAESLGVYRMQEGLDTTVAAGAVRWKQLAIPDHDGETAEDGNTRNVAPNKQFDSAFAVAGSYDRHNPYLILPGQSFAMTLDASAEADSGAVRAWVEYVELPFNGEPIAGTNITRDTTQD